MRHVPVLIIGSGPVGLTLGIDLAPPGIAALPGDPEALVDAPRALGAPCAAHSIPPEAAALYECPTLVIRLDGHVAWRGHAPPEDLPGRGRADLRRAVCGLMPWFVAQAAAPRAVGSRTAEPAPMAAGHPIRALDLQRAQAPRSFRRRPTPPRLGRGS